MRGCDTPVCIGLDNYKRATEMIWTFDFGIWHLLLNLSYHFIVITVVSNIFPTKDSINQIGSTDWSLSNYSENKNPKRKINYTQWSPLSRGGTSVGPVNGIPASDPRVLDKCTNMWRNAKKRYPYLVDRFSTGVVAEYLLLLYFLCFFAGVSVWGSTWKQKGKRTQRLQKRKFISS